MHHKVAGGKKKKYHKVCFFTLQFRVILAFVVGCFVPLAVLC